MPEMFKHNPTIKEVSAIELIKEYLHLEEELYALYKQY